MQQREKITGAVYLAIDEVNMLLPLERRLAKSVETSLMDGSQRIDSLALVNLIVAIEEQIEDEFGYLVNLADKEAATQQSSPLRTVGSVIDYIELQLQRER